MPVFQPIDDIEVPEMKDAPKRALVCIVFTLAGFAVSIFLAFVFEYFNRVKNNPDENAKLRSIVNSVKIFKRKKPR
jgi:hypothetical protein